MTGSGRRLLLSPYLGVLRDAVLPVLGSAQQIIVPNRSAGRGLIQWRSPLPRPVTLTRLAQDTLQHAGWTALPARDSERWIRDALAALPLTTLAPIRERDGTVTCLMKLIWEFQRSHLHPAALLQVASSGREHDAAQVYAVYHARCVAERRYDAAGAEHHAALLDDVTCAATVVHGFAYIDAAQTALLHRVCGPGSVMTLPAAAGGSARTQETRMALIGCGWIPEPLLGRPHTAGDDAIHGFLTRTLVPDLTAGESGDIEGEVRACLRQVGDRLAAGTPPEQLAILVRNEGVYLDTLADVAAEYRIPLRSGQRRPLLSTGVGQLLQAWLDAHTQGWTFRACEALLTHPLIDRPDLLERARILRSTAPAGLDAWGDGLRWLALPDHTTWRGALIGTVERMLTEFGLLTRCEGDPPLNRLVRTLLQHLGASVQRTAPCTREAVLAFIGFLLRSVQVPALTGKSAVAVLNPLGALGCAFEGVWILGLSDGIFPAARRDHPLIDTPTRQRWSAQGVHVPDVRSLASVEDALILAMLGTARSTLVISRPRRGLDGEPLRPSPYWNRLRAGQGPAALDAGSAGEQELRRALAGSCSPRVTVGAAIERTRALRLATPHSGRLTEAPTISSQPWTLADLHVATTCRMRWWLESGLQLTSRRRAWDDLARAALEGALGGGAPASDQRAARALDLEARRLQQSGVWRPGALWPAQRLELLNRIRRVVTTGDVLTPGATPLPVPRDATLTLAAHGHRFQLQLELDRVEDTPQGRRVTVYRRTGATGASGPLTPDMQLALTIHAAHADHGRYVALDTGHAFGTLHHVARPNRDSPITQARDLLAQLGDRLAAGDVQPLHTPDHALCRRCPVHAVCRVRRVAVAA